MRQSGGAKAGLFVVTLKAGVELFDLAFELRDFIVQHAGAVGDNIRFLFERKHTDTDTSGGQRPPCRSNSAINRPITPPKASNKGHVKARPNRQS